MLALLLEEYACELLASHLSPERARQAQAPHLALSSDYFLNSSVGSPKGGDLLPRHSSSESSCLPLPVAADGNFENTKQEGSSPNAVDTPMPMVTEGVSATPLVNRKDASPDENFVELDESVAADNSSLESTREHNTSSSARGLKRKQTASAGTSARKRRRWVRRSKASDSEYSREGSDGS